MVDIFVGSAGLIVHFKVCLFLSVLQGHFFGVFCDTQLFFCSRVQGVYGIYNIYIIIIYIYSLGLL